MGGGEARAGRGILSDCWSDSGGSELEKVLSPGTPPLPKFPSLDGRQSTRWGVTAGQWVPPGTGSGPKNPSTTACAQLFQASLFMYNRCLTNVCHLSTLAKS